MFKLIIILIFVVPIYFGFFALLKAASKKTPPAPTDKKSD